MLVIVGWITVVICTLGGYVALGGHLGVLWQPFELVIIFGSGCGAYIVANNKTILKATGREVKTNFKGARYNKDSYLELLSMLYAVFRQAKTKGWLSLEQHIENPHESELFQQFPNFYNDHHAVTFLCDYLRIISMGSDNAFEIEALMDEELETHHAELHQVSGAMQTMADGLPALGIVAAVLGVIKTMGSITEPPEVLGKLIGGALVGTFLGVWLAYGFIGPLASSLKIRHENEGKYYQAIKVALLANLQGYAPALSVEFARKTLFSDVRPSFAEVEEATAAVATPA
ncbi:MAG TPA: flagellar motor stator protein MotA [Rhodospirillaceae bacterium]|nr:flagellar motor stator protein MotA [Alphaproteobacteria bacterium]OUT42698.1 MAG: flagellar motor stator protein MotA [Micavibrio sp. TMED2]HCI46806.1 flagellar motor stator protein MotA [Rhodospirillaceae bacterium]MAS46221.1 flagellar motor stator protein MotA [Alphaproteobacteria bacterium]MAX95594.1 flagellar motor stator protein MotA [Alphaproteobacteria bacterium]